MYCSRLQLQVGCSLHFEFTLVVFYVMFFNSIKEIKRFRNEMSNTYLSVTIEKSDLLKTSIF